MKQFLGLCLAAVLSFLHVSGASAHEGYHAHPHGLERLFVLAVLVVVLTAAGVFIARGGFRK